MAKFTPEDYKKALDVRALQDANRWIEGSISSVEKYGEAFGWSTEKIKDHVGWLRSFKDTGQAGVDRSLALGRAVEQGGLSFDNMTSAIGKAVLKVGFWMVATTAVIGTIKKVQEAVQIWKDLELSLERIGITTRIAGKDLKTYFEEASDVAIRMGMPIQQVMTGMNLALRATAGLEDQTKRAATAQLMLRDAAILGNLAGMQFDQAINVLVGSLRQTGMQLHEGIFLLDKWVAVSRSAGVSINDLAQGFAVMAAAAESAGVSVDQINGLIAALSESVTLGPVEIGNAIRALMSTLYNPESISLLQNFGIAARDVTGEFRSFWDIMSELSSLRMTGALSHSQLLEISKAAGAGQRRYAQFQAILKNWDTAVKVSVVSSNAQNEALVANERIVNTLINAWDQMTAAQSKFLFALGQNSGAIEELTKLMQGLARAFDWMSGLDENLAKTIKLVAQLTAAFVGLKIALLVLTKIAVAGWLGGIGKSMMAAGLWKSLGLAKQQIVGATGKVSPLFGIGPKQQQVFSTMSHQAMQTPTGKWQDPATGRWVKAPTPIITTQAVRPDAKELAKQSWVGVGASIKEQANTFGKALIKPMGTLGTTFGIIAGGMMMRELYKSDKAGIGGAIGAMAGAKFGIVGMAAGSLIGGAIGHAIEVSGMTAAQLMAKETEAFFKRVPMELATALRASAEDMDFSKTTFIPLDELGDLQLKRLQELLESEQASLGRRMWTWKEGYGMTREPDREMFEELAKLPRIRKPSPIIMSLEGNILSQLEKIESIELAIRNVNKEVGKTVTEYDRQAAAMVEIIDTYNLREDAEKKINELIADSSDLSESFLESQIRLAGAIPTAQAKLLVQLEKFAPHLAEEFVKSYPRFEEFFALDPKAYEPLQQVLSTITQLTQDQEKYNIEIAETRRILEELGIAWDDVPSKNIDAIKEQKLQWSELLDRVLKYGHSLKDYYTQWNLMGLPVEERADAAQRKLMNLVRTIESGEESLINWVFSVSEVAANSALIDKNFKKLSTYIPEGRLEFLGLDANVSQIQAMLDKYSELFKGFIKEGEPQTYHAFIRDEFGVVQGLLETFKAQPEVWSAMLAELKGIERNTAARLEAEYNIPSWYQTPTRYWAMKTTGMKEGFGPAQEGMWELWMEFLARHRDGIKDMPIELPKVDSSAAVNSIDDLNASLDQTAESATAAQVAIEGFDFSPWKFMEEATKDSGFAGTADLSFLDRLKLAVKDFFNLGSTESELDKTSFSDRIRNFVSGLWQVDETAQKTGTTFNNLGRDLSSSSDNMSLSIRTASGTLRGATSEVYRFADSVNYLASTLNSPTQSTPYLDGGRELIPMSTGGVVPKTGPYYLHKQEVVSSVSDIKNTNALLGGSYKVLLVSQSYLSSINLGINGIRQELSLLRQQVGQSKTEGSGFTEFKRVTNTGYVGVNSLGTRRM